MAGKPTRQIIGERGSLLTVPVRAKWYQLLIVFLAISAIGWSATAMTTTAAQWLTLGVLVVCAVVHNELARGIERGRREASGPGHVDLCSVWLFAGALLLPLPLVGLLLVLVYGHYQWRSTFIALHRRIFSVSVLVLSALAAQQVLVLIGGPGHLFGPSVSTTVAVILLALVVYTGVDVALIATRVHLYGAPGVTVRKVFGDPSKHMLEISTLFYGSLLAFAVGYSPALVVLAFPPVLMLHRSVLLKQVEEKASKDAKTGLFNSEGWHTRASRERSRALRAREGFGLLMVDLDHFKKVNDTYGHVAGDAVLKAVADAISGEVRDYDSVGRFGGEEFVVLLPGMSEDDGVGVAERIRHAVTQLVVEAPVEGRTTIIRNLSASIGVSTFPQAGDDIEPLLLAADAALYQAKNSGRNRVVASTALAKPVLAVAA
ncbi:MAG TPA: GGDEF domain-containing protein [Kutzneria sp.]|jgi:diguanylate cyclase (GGDEF)-like protein|nr:GGDEF domain-containing protein [Kutzneria sp.]